ncbi:MAG: site-specific integrase [Bacteroidetes bacterium]|nr:site-specific integrase [Bacteroidota bacterium]
MPNLKLSLDKRKQKQDKTYPLVFRISANGQCRDIPLGHSVPENQWDKRAETLKKSAPTYEVLTTRIKELQVQYLSKIVEYERANPHQITAQALKDYILLAPKPKTTVVSFWNQEIDHLQKVERNGTARTYIETLVAIQKVKSLQIPFNTIDHSFLKEVEAELISRGIKINSIGLYYRTLRAVYNKAIHAKEASYEHYPFRTYKIRKEPTRPRVLTSEELRNFFSANIDKSSWLYDSWLMGKLMFMLIGINFKDMVLMRENQIQHGRLIYNRAKTKRQYSILLLPEALTIIQYFSGRSEHTVLGKVTAEQIQDKVKLPLLLRQRNKIFNKHLDRIGKMIGCKEKLTGYCFRYSTANIAKQLGYSKDLISEALGHSMGLRVTGIYLENFDLDIIDNMNRCVCESVMIAQAER